MEAFDLTGLEEPRVIGIICAWCNRETGRPIKSFDGRMLCANQIECWKVGTKLSHSVKIDPSRMPREVPPQPPKALDLRAGMPIGSPGRSQIPVSNLVAWEF